MQLEDLSKDELIAIVARQDESLVEERRINILLREQVEQHRKDDQPVQQPAPVADALLDDARSAYVTLTNSPQRKLDDGSIAYMANAYVMTAFDSFFAAPVAAPVADATMNMALSMVDACMDVTQVEPEDAAAWQIVRGSLAAPVPAASVQPGWQMAPHYRGYAALGTGQYVLNHSAAGAEPEFVISIATEAEKSGRTVGDERDNADDAVLMPDAMAMRIAFTNVAGLDAMEKQLRQLRAVHFPMSQPDSGRDAALVASVTALAWKWHRDAVKDGFACSEPAQELFEVLGWPTDPAMSAPAKTDKG